MKQLDIQLNILSEDPCQTIQSALKLCDAAQGMLIQLKQSLPFQPRLCVLAEKVKQGKAVPRCCFSGIGTLQ